MLNAERQAAIVELLNQRGRVLANDLGVDTIHDFMKPWGFGQITGIDVDDRIIDIAERKIAAAGARINLERYDGITLPYPDDRFDRVISSLVLHHLSREQKLNALREIHRVLRAGGELHIADWGKADTLVDRLLFLPVQMLDGFAITSDNVAGLLPALIADAGPDTAAIRHDWGQTLTELADDNFLKPIHGWAEEHHTLFRSQTYGYPPVTLSSNRFEDLPEGEGKATFMMWRQFSDTRWAPAGATPECGQHTEEVLLELGYDWERIGALKEGGVIP